LNYLRGITLIFTELVLENFGPYLGKQVINLRPEADDNTRPIILFGGMNGGGKTTLMDAIRLALYGIRAQCSNRDNLSYGDFLSQCVNRNTPPGENTRVELAFEHVLNDKLVEYRIVRTWIKNPKDGKDNLGIIDNDWPDPYLADTWDEYIENLLPLGISNLFLFDGEQVKELAELEIPPPLVVQAIESMLGLELAERLSQDLNILVRRKQKALANAKELTNLDEIEQKLQQHAKEKDAAIAEVGELKKKLDIAQKRYRQASENFLSEGGKIAADRNLLDQKLQDLKGQADKTCQEMRELAAGSIPLALISSLLTQALAQAETEAQYKRAKMTRDVLHDRDRRLLDYLTQLSLQIELLEKIQSFLDQENLALAQTLETAEPWLLPDPEAVKQLQSLLGYHIQGAQATGSEKLAQLKQLEIEIHALEKRIAAAAAPEAYEKLQEGVTQTQTEVAKARAAWENCDRRRKESEQAIDKIKKELHQYTEESIKISFDQHFLKAAARVQNTLKLFREKLTLKKLNKLEGEVTECFRYLLHKPDLVHRVAIDTQNFSLSLFDPQGKPVPKRGLSAGEKQLLAISFLWGLARVSARQLPVAIDTPLGRLDSEHRQNSIERYFPSASHQVILLSTDTEIGETEVETLRKQNAIAREYLLQYDSTAGQTIVQEGYFW